MPLATRCATRLEADPSRVIARLFVPGHYLPSDDDEQASTVVDHILAMSDGEVIETLDGIMRRFDDRHPDLGSTFSQHADRIGNRLHRGATLSEARWSLLGATFTHEYAVEAAALCNPSTVVAPDQTGVPAGALRFVMTVRQIGEGHRSSIGFRTGILDAHHDVAIDATGPGTTSAAIASRNLEATLFRDLELGWRGAAQAIRWVLGPLGEEFSVADLADRLALLEAQHDTRQNVTATARALRELAARSYAARFDPSSQLSERVLYPATSAENNGMEDARLVRFVDDDGAVTYRGSYTAFDGSAIVQQLLETTDFVTFTSSPLLGAAAANKGLALFPRRVGGRFAALSRHDGCSNAIAYSEDLCHWPSAVAIESPIAPWETIQTGNCGPPIETDGGWLLLTHGVGPMRTYSIGAWLLDLQDPTKLVGRLPEPLLTPQPDEQDGYVPNVVYSCGAVVHDGTMLIPYGISDAAIGFATASVDAVLGAMEPP